MKHLTLILNIQTRNNNSMSYRTLILLKHSLLLYVLHNYFINFFLLRNSWELIFLYLGSYLTIVVVKILVTILDTWSLSHLCTCRHNDLNAIYRKYVKFILMLEDELVLVALI